MTKTRSSTPLVRSRTTVSRSEGFPVDLGKTGSRRSSTTARRMTARPVPRAVLMERHAGGRREVIRRCVRPPSSPASTGQDLPRTRRVPQQRPLRPRQARPPSSAHRVIEKAPEHRRPSLFPRLPRMPPLVVDQRPREDISERHARARRRVARLPSRRVRRLSAYPARGSRRSALHHIAWWTRLGRHRVRRRRRDSRDRVAIPERTTAHRHDLSAVTISWAQLRVQQRDRRSSRVPVHVANDHSRPTTPTSPRRSRTSDAWASPIARSVARRPPAGSSSASASRARDAEAGADARGRAGRQPRPATSHSVMKYSRRSTRGRHHRHLLAAFLSLARRYGSRVVALKGGKVAFDGKPTRSTSAGQGDLRRGRRRGRDRTQRRGRTMMPRTSPLAACRSTRAAAETP